MAAETGGLILNQGDLHVDTSWTQYTELEISRHHTGPLLLTSPSPNPSFEYHKASKQAL